MKNIDSKITGIVFSLFFLLLLNSCTSEEEAGKFPSKKLTYSLSVNKEFVEVSAKDGTVELSVTSDGRWTVTANRGWINLNGVTEGLQDGIVKVDFEDYYSIAEPRTGAITFHCNGKDYVVDVKQLAASSTVFGKPMSSGIQRDAAIVETPFDAMFPVSEYGVVYSKTNSKPTIDDLVVNVTENLSNNKIQVQLTGLESRTQYYYRLYVKSALGIEYSTEDSFTTLGGIPGNKDNKRPE